MTFYLILTSASVSLDSLIAGISVGASAKHEQKTCLGVITAVAAMCSAAYFLTEGLARIFLNYADRLGGIILIAVGLIGFAKASLPTVQVEHRLLKPPFYVRKRALNPFCNGLITGLGVGTDGACACISLALAGYGFLSAISVTAFHYAFLQLGVAISSLPIKFAAVKKYAPLLLVLLGAYRFI